MLNALLLSPWGQLAPATQRFLDKNPAYQEAFSAVIDTQRWLWKFDPYDRFQSLYEKLSSVLNLVDNSDGNLWWTALFRSLQANYAIGSSAYDRAGAV